jgi:hypothetical protein
MIIIFYAHEKDSSQMPATATFKIETMEELISRSHKFKKDIATWFNNELEYSWLILNYNEFNTFHKGANKILLNEFGKNYYDEQITG